MATFLVTWTPAGSVSDGQYIYYGKTNVVTGNPLSGTGWTLYTGNALVNSVGSANIVGLDDNVEYSFSGYAHCPDAGNGPLVNFGPNANYVCPTLTNIVPSYNGVSYTLNIPNSANNSGTWIEQTKVNVLSGSSVLQTNTYNTPFNGTINGSFTSLNSSLGYALQIIYSNNSGNRTSICGSIPFTTTAPCEAPVITLSNPTANSFDVNWTPTTGGTFDIIVNNSVIASGLTTGPYTVTNLTANTSYQASVRKNCVTGGNAISTTQNITTTQTVLNGTISISIPQPYNAQQQTTTVSLTFPAPTPSPITLYFGALFEQSCNTCTSTGKLCKSPWGYELFAPPADQCAGFPPGVPASYAYAISVPSGVTSFSATNIAPRIYYGPGTLNFITESPALGQVPGRGWTDLYVKIASPSGLVPVLTYQNSTNVQGVTVHNIAS